MNMLSHCLHENKLQFPLNLHYDWKSFVNPGHDTLTHGEWLRIYVSIQNAVIGSNNGLPPSQHQVIP